jgi:hypothetical protein
MGFPVHGCCPCVARKGETPVALAVLLAIENLAKESQSDQLSCRWLMKCQRKISTS